MHTRATTLFTLLAVALLCACVAPSTSGPDSRQLELEGSAAANVTQAASTENSVIEVETPEPMPLTIHRLKLNPANAYLIEAPDGLILVDTSMSFYAKRILEEIAELDKGPLCLIYITHAHIDHYGGAAAIRKATGAPVAIHELDAEAMEGGDTRLGTVRNWNWTGSVTPWVEKAIRSAQTTPDILLKDGDAIEECGLNGEVIWTPGHTPGSTSLLVHQDDGSHVFVGDLISNSGSLHVQTTYADDWKLLIPSVEKVQSFAPDWYYPGHGDAPVPAAAVDEMEHQGPATR